MSLFNTKVAQILTESDNFDPNEDRVIFTTAEQCRKSKLYRMFERVAVEAGWYDPTPEIVQEINQARKKMPNKAPGGDKIVDPIQPFKVFPNIFKNHQVIPYCFVGWRSSINVLQFTYTGRETNEVYTGSVNSIEVVDSDFVLFTTTCLRIRSLKPLYDAGISPADITGITDI